MGRNVSSIEESECYAKSNEVTFRFEIAANDDLKSSFPYANLKGCIFHFAQKQIGKKFNVLDWQKNT